MIRRLVCKLFGHALPAGLNRRFCFRYECARCHNVVPGDLGGRR